MTKRIDNVLAYLRKSVSTNDQLKHLESDVWARIVAEKSEQPVGFLEGLLASIFPAQHRFAPVMAAAVLGVMVGFSTLQPPATPDAAEMLNFKVFKPKVIVLSSITPNYERL
jgi:hypothetical protein